MSSEKLMERGTRLNNAKTLAPRNPELKAVAIVYAPLKAALQRPGRQAIGVTSFIGSAFTAISVHFEAQSELARERVDGANFLRRESGHIGHRHSQLTREQHHREGFAHFAVHLLGNCTTRG